MNHDFYIKHRLNARKSWDQLSDDYRQKIKKMYLDSLHSKLDNKQSDLKNNSLTPISANHFEHKNNDSSLTPISTNNINKRKKESSPENSTGDSGCAVVSENHYNPKALISSNALSSSSFNTIENNIDDKRENTNKNKNLDVSPIHNFSPSTGEVTEKNTDNSYHDESPVLENNNGKNNEETENEEDEKIETTTNEWKKFKVSQYNELFKSRLAQCIVTNKINASQSNELLKILRDHPQLQFLPKDSRSLLKTPRNKTKIKQIPPGEYLHLGLEFMINIMLRYVPEEDIPTKLIIDFSTDGVELNKETQLWPIQFRIVNLLGSKPELAGIYKGNSKPNSFADFFSDFVVEVNKIVEKGGINFHDKKIPVELRCFVADAPARSYVLNHYGHNSQYPCSKCHIKGTSFMGANRFPGINHKLRNNTEYRSLKDVDHHKGQSALHDLPIDLVQQVSFDYMHLVCLGVMKKTIESVVFGKCKPAKLPPFKVNILSNRLTTLQLYCPREFARIPRELDKFTTFKATEFRQLLLYTFIVVFQGVISDDQYNHFLLLHCAMRILLSNSSSEDVSFAGSCLKSYVLEAVNIYSLQFLTYNSHGLLHLVSDYELYGPLDSVSAFQYENQMPKYREAIRKPDKPLQQIHKRNYEECLFSYVEEKITKIFKASNSHDCGPIPKEIENESTQYENLETPTFYFSIQNTDNTLITHNDYIGIIKNIILYNYEYYFAVYFFTDLRPFYIIGNKPSTHFGVYLCTSLDDNQAVLIAYKDVKTKCYRMPLWVKKPFINKNVNDEQLNNVYVVVTL